MQDELRPLEAALIARNPSFSSVNLWLGADPVVAPCHYDGYHNAVAQLSGRKRFMLAPPSAGPLLRTFPFLHPSHAQCQTALEDVDQSSLRSAGGLSVVLERGNVLYLPPLWFHETRALDSGGAVGVNGWVQCEEGSAADRVFEVRRPVAPSGWATRQPASSSGKDVDDAAAALALVAQLSARVFNNATHLLERVWRDRYATLVGRNALPLVALSGAGTSTAGGNRVRALECSLLPVWRTRWDQRDDARRWASAVALQARDHLRSEATRTLWLANLAELVVAEQVGVRRVATVWRAASECLSMLPH